MQSLLSFQIAVNNWIIGILKVLLDFIGFNWINLNFQCFFMVFEKTCVLVNKTICFHEGGGEGSKGDGEGGGGGRHN